MTFSFVVRVGFRPLGRALQREPQIVRRGAGFGFVSYAAPPSFVEFSFVMHVNRKIDDSKDGSTYFLKRSPQNNIRDITERP
jgi:hypothetical protein